tara:strand:+ start:708 stop:2915 length:2208 start_codon:yes stop_codon:yes gene_type:complete
MIKKIIKLLTFFIAILVIVTLYLSYFGIETKRFNKIIKDGISKNNKELDIELKKAKILLNLTSLTVGINIKNPKILFNNKKIDLKNIESELSIKSFLNEEFAIKNLAINTKQNKLKNVISFIKLYNNTPQMFIINNIIKDGIIKSSIKINFDENGKVIEDYKINGSILNTKISLFNKKIISNIKTDFTIKKNSYSFDNSSLEFEKINLTSKKINILKKDENNYFEIKGDFKNLKSLITPEIISIIFEQDLKNLIFNKTNFSTENNFEFKINNKLKVSDFYINSKINIDKIFYKQDNLDMKIIFPSHKKTIELKDHEIELEFDKSNLSLKGKGKFLIDKKFDSINYDIRSDNKDINFATNINLKNTPINFKLLNFKKNNKENAELNINGVYYKNKFIKINKFSFKESKNIFFIEDLNLNSEYKFNSVKIIKLDFNNQKNKHNKISLIKNKKNYKLEGSSFDATVLIDELLEADNNDTISIFNKLDSNLKINIDKTHIDDVSYVNNLNGNIEFLNSKIEKLNLQSNFPNNQKMTLTINRNKNNEKVTTLHSSYPKPLVKRYKFIKGYEEGVLDFYSTKKNNISRSVLKIDNFKVKEVPALAKLLSLASLQGIADLLTGEGIRFTDFEMIFSNDDKLMTIEEIYAIGPAISIMMSGYVEKDNLISLRGTLVPARTINRTISSIPVIGDILIGKKVGEGVFGVSFKIKGPPKDLKTTVNPIKTLTPRFITRTLEKIKNN